MHDAVIVADKLKVTRGGVAALTDVTFSITPGKITGLIGPSGSGKTTLIRAIVGAQVITNGSLEVMGEPAGSKTLRTRIGYMPQTPAVYTDLTTLQNLQYFGTILGAGAKDINTVLKQVDLQPQADQVVGTLSGGQLARVSLAVVLLSKAELLVLDEPTAGLDPVLREQLWDLFREIAASGHSLLVSSHIMDEAEKCADILLLRDGRVLSHSSKQELLRRTHKPTVEAAFLSLARGGMHAS
jgi:ABC-2 type transport system ATP-binding protein